MGCICVFGAVREGAVAVVIYISGEVGGWAVTVKLAERSSVVFICAFYDDGRGVLTVGAVEGYISGAILGGVLERSLVQHQSLVAWGSPVTYLHRGEILLHTRLGE